MLYRNTYFYHKKRDTIFLNIRNQTLLQHCSSNINYSI